MPEVTANSGLLKKTKVHVDDSGGDGRPVVLIHGWPLSAASWSEQTGPLSAAGYRVVAYDRRGFGRSDKPTKGYDYDTLADDLDGVLSELELTDATIVGFSMGGGEVVRYLTKHGSERIHSAVLAAAVPPFLKQTEDNPDGPLDDATAQEFEDGLNADRDAFFEQFATDFYSANGELKVTEAQRQEAVALAKQSEQAAVMGCMESFAMTDFREELPKITVPTLVLHGDADGIVPFEGSGKRSHEAIGGSELVLIEGGPHGLNVSHADKFNAALIDFLNR